MGLMSDFRTRVDDVGWSARVIFNEFMKFNLVGCFNSAFAFLLYLMLYQINLWDANAKMLERRPMADFIHVLMDDEFKLIYRKVQQILFLRNKNL